MINITLFFAALSPLMQETKEIKAILNDSRLDRSLQGEVIQKIEKIEGGYLFTTDLRQTEVKVRYLPSTMLGPAKFELIFP